MDLYPDTKEGADKSIATLAAYENGFLDIALSELETEELYNALDEEIAEATGMNSSVRNTLRDALDEISTMASKYENALLNAEIGELNIH